MHLPENPQRVPHLVEQFRRAASGERFYFEINGWGYRADWSDSREIVQALAQFVDNPPKTDLAIGTGKGISVMQIVIETIQLLGLDQKDFCNLYGIPKLITFEPTLVADLSEINLIFP